MKQNLKKATLVMVGIMAANLLYGQVNEKVVDQLIIRSLRSKAGMPEGGIKYIEANEYTLRVKDSIHYPCKLVLRKELFNMAYQRKNRSIGLIRVVPKIISEDTIDINLGYVSLKVKKGIYFKYGLYFKEAELSLSCGGTNGYQPDYRYAYNAQEATWEKVENPIK